MSLRKIHRKPLKESRRFSFSKRSRRLNELNFAFDYNEDLSENPEELFDIFIEYLKENLDGDIPVKQGSILPESKSSASCKIYLGKIKDACELFLKKYLPDYYEKIDYKEGKDYIKVDLYNVVDYFGDLIELDLPYPSYKENGKRYYTLHGDCFGSYWLLDYLKMKSSEINPLYHCLSRIHINIQGSVAGEIIETDKNDAEFCIEETTADNTLENVKYDYNSLDLYHIETSLDYA